VPSSATRPVRPLATSHSRDSVCCWDPSHLQWNPLWMALRPQWRNRAQVGCVSRRIDGRRPGCARRGRIRAGVGRWPLSALRCLRAIAVAVYVWHGAPSLKRSQHRRS
jgi:hypothetical protein